MGFRGALKRECKWELDPRAHTHILVTLKMC